MKKYNKFGYVGAMMLAGLVSFSSCSSDDDEMAEVVNPVERPTVKTQFALNIPRAGKAGRMTAETTQQPEKEFRGIEFINLLPLVGAPVEGGGDAQAINGEILKLMQISSADGTVADGARKIYSDVMVPEQTDHFLFYGFAPFASATYTSDDPFAEGQLISPLFDNSLADQTLKSVNFALKPCAQDGHSAVLEKIVVSLNNIHTALKTAIESAHTAANGGGGVKEKAKAAAVETGLTEIKKTFVATRQIAASGVMLRAMLEQLYAKVIQLDDAKTYTGDLLTAIASDEAAEYDGDTKKALLYKYIAATGKFTGWNNGIVAENDMQVFPGQFNLPSGSVQVDCDGADFSVFNISGQVGANPLLKPENLCYPAALAYYVNTPIHTSNTAKQEGEFPTAANWTGELFRAWDGTTVTFQTKAVALDNKINYGVANMSTQIRCKTASLPDAAKPTSSNQPHFVVVPTGGFDVTGILIGGQPVLSGWDFLPEQPNSDENKDFAKVIYDKTLNGTLKAPTIQSQSFVAQDAGTAGLVNYTLVLDNTKTVADNDVENDVNIAVEFTNNSASTITGKDGIIPVNGKFYLIAKLQPNELSGNTTKKPVFQRDHTTVVKLTINTLANAYVTIPDLRSTQLSLGMAVDLKWVDGLTFDTELGGI